MLINDQGQGGWLVETLTLNLRGDKGRSLRPTVPHPQHITTKK